MAGANRRGNREGGRRGREVPALPRPTGQDLLGLCRGLARTHHPSAHRVGLIVAPSAAQRCTDGFLRACRRLADEFDLPAMIHCQETRMQIVTAEAFYGRSMVAHLADLGFLGPRTALVHGTWLSRRDLELIAASGATVQYNPWSNLDVGGAERGVPFWYRCSGSYAPVAAVGNRDDIDWIAAETAAHP